MNKSFKYLDIERILALLEEGGHVPTSLTIGEKSHPIGTRGYNIMFNKVKKYDYIINANVNFFGNGDNGELVIPYDEPSKKKFVKFNLTRTPWA